MENFQDRGVCIRIWIRFVLRGWIRFVLRGWIRNPDYVIAYIFDLNYNLSTGSGHLSKQRWNTFDTWSKAMYYLFLSINNISAPHIKITQLRP